ncbi:restriction endonuclease [Xanthocytophaga flava]|uniref:restriction endonuclease n=1 Tax=Xanthocytophaga flava TaxID=3048013 RepID=UPI0028D67F09|nr:restriction endonuclease [Xanthocytophaga flavus]MDJ1471983.1 restriction endonuclease [Xanthocytophaga flavus]
MAIPDYQTIMLPLLKYIADGKDYKLSDTVEGLAKNFKLTDQEKAELLPSGSAFTFTNRVHWAKTYLKKAGLLDSPKRSMMVITQRGLGVLQQNITRIDVKYLMQFPEFVDFVELKREDNKSSENNNDTIKQTPEETFEGAYQSIRKSLAQELLAKVVSLPPAFFEKMVVELLVGMGYGGSLRDAGKALGKSGDEGIDGTIKEDKLGLDVIYIQAKRWQPGNIVGRPEIQKFVGALAGQGAKKGIFITTSSFSKEALEYVPRNETKIVLLDGSQLTQLMIDYNIGVTTQHIYELKKMDNDYFELE